MARYWALWLASILFKIAAIISLAASVFMSLVPFGTSAHIARLLGILVPQPQINTAPQGQLDLSIFWVSSIFNGVLYAVALYALGQACVLLIDAWYDGQLTAKAIFSRIGAKRPTAATGEPQLDWKSTDNDPSDALVSKRETLGYSRRFRQPAPQVPPDDPRRPRTYRKDEVTSNVPDSRLPRPKSKG